MAPPLSLDKRFFCIFLRRQNEMMMKTYLKSLILTIALCLALSACDNQTKRMEQVRTLYEEGVQLREQRRSEEAAEKFLQGLAVVRQSEKTTESVQLEGQLCDNLGAMYLKHELNEDAFKQHQRALRCFRQTADSTGMMNAYRNSGRAVRAQKQYTQAKQYYDSAFRIATFIGDKAMQGDLYLEMGRDYYMETGNYAEGIESVNMVITALKEKNSPLSKKSLIQLMKVRFMMPLWIRLKNLEMLVFKLILSIWISIY